MVLLTKAFHAHIVKIDKTHLHIPILGCFKGCGYNSRATFNGAGMVLRIQRKTQSPLFLAIFISKIHVSPDIYLTILRV